MATDVQLRLLAVLRGLEARFVFDELDAEQDLLRRVLASPFNAEQPTVTSEDFRAALEMAVDEDILRGIEVEPGRFLLVRTERAERDGDSSAGWFAGWRPPIEALPDGMLETAMKVSPETVALRRAILDETQFVWPRDDYLALLDVATANPRG